MRLLKTWFGKQGCLSGEVVRKSLLFSQLDQEDGVPLPGVTESNCGNVGPVFL